MRSTQYSFAAQPAPAIAQVDRTGVDGASVAYRLHRSGLSHRRTEVSEHRTALSIVGVTGFQFFARLPCLAPG